MIHRRSDGKLVEDANLKTRQQLKRMHICTVGLHGRSTANPPLLTLH